MEKVLFLGASEAQINWGGNDDPNPILEVGTIYEVSKKDIHSWHTKIELKEFPGMAFNDASFEYCL